MQPSLTLAHSIFGAHDAHLQRCRSDTPPPISVTTTMMSITSPSIVMDGYHWHNTDNQRPQLSVSTTIVPSPVPNLQKEDDNGHPQPQHIDANTSPLTSMPFLLLL